MATIELRFCGSCSAAKSRMENFRFLNVSLSNLGIAGTIFMALQMLNCAESTAYCHFGVSFSFASESPIFQFVFSRWKLQSQQMMFMRISLLQIVFITNIIGSISCQGAIGFSEAQS